MSRKYATQGRCLVVLLSKRALTYGEMVSAGFGLSPWKRVKEALKADPSRQVQTGKRKVNGELLTTWRVVKTKEGA